MPKIIQKQSRLLSNIHLSGNYYKLVLKLPKIARLAVPGQFVMLRLSDRYQPFLRRPFSIHRAGYSSKAQHRRGYIKNLDPNIIEILYEVIGKGTEVLSRKQTGEYLNVLGPLGNGFSILDSQLSILVGGGIGIAPLLFLAERIKALNSTTHRIQILIGAKTKKEILSQKDFMGMGLNVKISTDNGSAGFKGRVTQLLKGILPSELKRSSPSMKINKYISRSVPLAAVIFACGPKPMLKGIAEISRMYKIPAQISLDEYMACGMGVCLGCMVKTTDGYQRVCQEGPVFDAAKVIWQR